MTVKLAHLTVASIPTIIDGTTGMTLNYDPSTKVIRSPAPAFGGIYDPTGIAWAKLQLQTVSGLYYLTTLVGLTTYEYVLCTSSGLVYDYNSTTDQIESSNGSTIAGNSGANWTAFKASAV